MARYALLPYWYTAFYEAYKMGTPTMRPMWMEYPTDSVTFSLDDQWLVGADLLVKPVTAPGVTRTEVYLPGGLRSRRAPRYAHSIQVTPIPFWWLGTEPWYDVDSHEAYIGPGLHTVATPLEKIAAFQKGGSIVPRKLRLRRSSSLMIHDPYVSMAYCCTRLPRVKLTLYNMAIILTRMRQRPRYRYTLFVALDSHNFAMGDLYMDDESTFEYQAGHYTSRHFTYMSGVLTGRPSTGIPSSKWVHEPPIVGVILVLFIPFVVLLQIRSSQPHRAPRDHRLVIASAEGDGQSRKRLAAGALVRI